MPVSKDLIKQLRDMEEKATKGDWEPLDNGVRIDSAIHMIRTDNPIFGDSSNDTYLICALRNNILPLLDEIERLQVENERLKQTSVEIEKSDGSKAYVQMHCMYPHDHVVHEGCSIKLIGLCQNCGREKCDC